MTLGRRIEEQAARLTEANRELDALHREKDQFFGITVHDLKTPLNSLLGFSGLLLDKSGLDRETREYLDFIHGSSRDMLEQVEDLLKLTELESQGETPMPKI